MTNVLRIYNYFEPTAYWSLSVTASSTVLEVSDDLAQKLLPDDEIFLILEIRQAKRGDKVKGGT